MQNGGQGGQGGASTVPDKARDVSASDHQSSGTAQETDDGSASVATPGDLLREMRKLDSRLDSQIRTMITLREELMNQTYGMQVQLLNTNATTPDIWPVKGEISSYFGYRSSPGGGIGSTYHEGIDIAGDYGLPIEATASGTITQAGWVGGYGNLVEIKHPGGIVTRYGHNSAILVTVGQHVDQGSVIAIMGSTGNSTGPHCHYEVRVNGTAVDPLYFLQATTREINSNQKGCTPKGVHSLLAMGSMKREGKNGKEKKTRQPAPAEGNQTTSRCSAFLSPDFSERR